MSSSGDRERFTIGGHVEATDGQCGQLIRVIVDPVAETLTYLVGALVGQQKMREAEVLARQALDLVREAFGAKHVQCVNALNGLAWLMQAKRDFAQSEALFKEVLEITRTAFKEEHSAHAEALHNLAMTSVAKGDLPAAEPLLRRAMDLQRRASGERRST